ITIVSILAYQFEFVRYRRLRPILKLDRFSIRWRTQQSRFATDLNFYIYFYAIIEIEKLVIIESISILILVKSWAKYINL
ncbi:hypothetical protein, partial [Chamaesiphon polymorphus]